MNENKIKKLKFVRNIIICLVALYIVTCVLDFTPGYKRDKYKDITNLIVNNKNVTEDLKNLIYVHNDGTIYISKQDVDNLLKNKINYDEKYNKVIIVSGKDIVYIPISEMQTLYNIKVKYIETSNNVIIDDLSQRLIKAQLSIETELKYKARNFSKTVTILKQGEEVFCFYTNSKGWREIRTSTGEVGYVQANTLINEVEVHD